MSSNDIYNIYFNCSHFPFFIAKAVKGTSINKFEPSRYQIIGTIVLKSMTCQLTIVCDEVYTKNIDFDIKTFIPQNSNTACFSLHKLFSIVMQKAFKVM